MSERTNPRAASGTRLVEDELVERTIPSPVGPLRVVASPRGIRAILWSDETGRVDVGRPTPGTNEHLARCEQQLAEYFAGDRVEFDVALDPIGTEFQRSVWAALRTIPYGETCSYGEQAAMLGDPRKARAVGAANGRNPISIVVPCHRVVGANGSLTGFAGGVDTKRWLLAHEAR
ncbi:MAG: methylated-DNA--[protein]-cysteine S-methyltransferase [Ilumatobacteraceae bacterium]